MIYQVMPPLSETDYAALKADIQARGVLVPVEYDEDGNILDGHHRVKICEELGIDFPRYERTGYTEEEKWTHARQLNIARRHLTQEQRRTLIADQLRQTPEFSDRRIAEGLGVNHETVGAVREELTGRGEIRHVATVTDTLGRVQPAKKPKLTKSKLIDNSKAGKAGAKERAREIRVEEAAEIRIEHQQRLASIVVPDGTYETVVIDPPWDMEFIGRDVRPNQLALDYPPMTEAELVAYRETVEPRLAPNCHMFMWTTQRFLPSALRILDAWGLHYVLEFVWHKPGGFQPFGLPQYNCEFALYATRGTPEFIDLKNFNCCFSAPRLEHSRKPDEFYDMVRRVTSGPRIDWFSREKREGFDQAGNEITKFGEAV